MRRLPRLTHLAALSALALACALPIPSPAADADAGPGPAAWANDLSPIAPQDWSYERASHLLERAGFGGTPEEIQRLAAMTPQEAVRYLVRFQTVDNSQLQPFDHSGMFDAGLDPFPASRPATTDQAKAQGRSARRQGQAGRQPAACSRW